MSDNNKVHNLKTVPFTPSDMELYIPAYDGNDNPIYIAIAQPGTLQATKGWQIVKLTWTAGNLTRKVFANGSNAYDKVGTSYAAYTYTP